jgi:Na+/phosphate symporter
MPAKKVVDFGPMGEKLVAMIGAARDAFNRHSRTGLDQFKDLHTAAAQEIDAAVKKLEVAAAQASAGDKTQLTAWKDLSLGLRQLVETLGGLSGPLSKKVKDGVLFSEKAVVQTNSLFDSQTGVIRSVFDIVQTGNDYLKKFVQAEGLKTQRDCADFGTEHETRLIEGLCTPQAAPIFLAILEHFRRLGQQEAEMIQKFSQKS